MQDLQSYLDQCAAIEKNEIKATVSANNENASDLAAQEAEHTLNRGIDTVTLLGTNPVATLDEFRSWPFRTTFSLQIRFPKGTESFPAIGSGTIIGSFEQIITCAHNLYDPEKGGYATEIIATAPDPLGKQKQDVIRIKAVPIKPGDKNTYVDPVYIQKRNSGIASHDIPENDWGMFTLEKAFTVTRENKTYKGKVGFVTGTVNPFSTQHITEHTTQLISIGYPKDQYYEMVIGKGTVQKTFGDIPKLEYDIPVSSGHSGGSLLSEFNLPDFKGIFLVGVHNSHVGNISRGARFNIDRINTIRAFIAQTETK